MKSRTGLIMMGILLCSIPAISYFAFRHTEDNPYATTQTQWPIEKEIRQYQLSLQPVHVPLKRGQQVLTLQVYNAAKPMLNLQPDNVSIVMPMGQQTMEAPLELQKTSTPGQYQLKTEFKMAGDWELQLQTADSAPIRLPFQVQL